MSMPLPGDVPSWTVTGQTERDVVQAAGPPVRGVTIFFTTSKGNQGTVWVPYSQYNQGPAVVAPLIADAAGRMDQIGALSAGS